MTAVAVGERTMGRPLLAGWTCTTMVFGTVAGPAVGILASTLIDRFDLTRADVGRLSALYALVGAAVSPLTGRLADRLGGRHMVVATFLGGAVTFLLYAAASGYALLLVAAAVSGVPNGTGNQATNRLIATRLTATERGVVTGVKQSGVQLGRFLAGLILPSTVVVWGLSRSYLAMAVLAVAGAALSLVLLPHDAPAGRAPTGAANPPGAARLPAAPAPVAAAPTSAVTAALAPAPAAAPAAPTSAVTAAAAPAPAPTAKADPAGAARLPAAVWWLTLYALLLGAAAGATGAFTALFGEQELGMTRAQAGFMVGLTGGAAVIARILLSGVAQRARHYGPPLAWIALGAAASLAVTAAAPRLGVAALWLGTVGTAVTIGSWNSVAMLAAMASVPPSQAGRSSGRVMVGFLSGLGVAPPLFGAAVDRTGSYLLGWGVLLGTCAVAGATMLLWWRRDQRPTEAVST